MCIHHCVFVYVCSVQTGMYTEVLYVETLNLFIYRLTTLPRQQGNHTYIPRGLNIHWSHHNSLAIMNTPSWSDHYHSLLTRPMNSNNNPTTDTFQLLFTWYLNVYYRYITMFNMFYLKKHCAFPEFFITPTRQTDKHTHTHTHTYTHTYLHKHTCTHKHAWIHTNSAHIGYILLVYT